MPDKTKKEKRKAYGIEGIVEKGVVAIYARGTWMKKLDDSVKRS